MTDNMSALGVLSREIEAAEAESLKAQTDYANLSKKAEAAQRDTWNAYDRCGAAQRKVDRLKRALAMLEGEDDV